MRLILEAVDPKTGRKALAFECQCGQVSWQDLDNGKKERKLD